MRAIDPPLRAAGDVLRVDGRELRTLGVVGVHGAARGDEHGVFVLGRSRRPGRLLGIGVECNTAGERRGWVLTDLIFHSTFSKVEWKIRSVIRTYALMATFYTVRPTVCTRCTWDLG